MSMRLLLQLYIIACFVPKMCYAQMGQSNNIVSYSDIPIYFPLNSSDFMKVSSAYGYRYHPLLKKRKLHEGIDLVSKKGKPVYATADGTIIRATYEKGYGNNIIIEHGCDAKTLYGHLWLFTVKKNQKVSRGQLIGLVGDTGKVTGPHLHYEIWLKGEKIDPISIWRKSINILSNK